MYYSHDPFTPVENVFRLSKFVGAYPITGWAKLFTLFTICLCGGSLMYDTGADIIGFKASTLIETILEVLSILQDAILFTVLCSGLNTYHRNDITEIFRAIYTGHDAVMKLGLVPKYRKYWSTVLASTVILDVVTAYALVYFKEEEESKLDILAHTFGEVLPRVASHMYISQYYAFMDLVQDQMTALVRGTIYHNHWYLESMVNAQSQLLKNAQTIFEMYEKPISILIIHATVSMMISAYEVAKLDAHLKIGVLLFELISVISVLHACDHTRSKADAFNSALFDLMRKNKDLCSNNKLHLYVTMKHTVNFTACGFFNLGYPLVTSIIAAATTYLVILIQFSMPTAPEPTAGPK